MSTAVVCQECGRIGPKVRVEWEFEPETEQYLGLKADFYAQSAGWQATLAVTLCPYHHGAVGANTPEV